MSEQPTPSERKPNSNAVLKNLPEERQAIIAGWCAKENDRDPETDKPIAESGGLAHAQAQLAADGQRVSLAVLSEFFRWWKARQRHQRNLASMEQIRKLAQEFRPGDAQFARQAVEITLLAKAAESENPDDLALAAKIHDQRRSLDLSEKSAETRGRQGDAKIAQKDRDLQLAERRVTLLETNAAKAKEQLAAVAKTGGLSKETLAQIEEAARLL